MRPTILFAIFLVLSIGSTVEEEEKYGSLEYGSYDDDDGGGIDGMDFAAFGKKKNASHLEIVYNRLAILTRITSAISLQYMAIKKSVKVRHVVTELLRSHAVDLDGLIDFDPSKMLPILKERYTAIMEIREKHGADMKKLEEKKELFEMMQRAINYVHNGDINDTQISDFYSKIESGEFDNTTVGCPNDFVNLMVNFYNLLIDSTDHSTTKKSDIIRKMNESSMELQKCITDLDHYGETVKELKMEFSNFVKLQQAKEGIIDFHDRKVEISNFGKDIDLLKKVFEKTNIFWKSAKVGNPIVKMMDHLSHILDQGHEKLELSLTLGFPESGDMAKVSKDLRSDWFRDKVAGGRSVAPLGRELQGFFQFGVLMRKLEKSWQILKTNYPRYKFSTFFLSQALDTMEGSELREEALGVAKSSKEAFEKAWTHNLVFNTEDLKSLDELPLVSEVWKEVDKIEGRAKDFKDQIDMAAVKLFFDQLSSMTIEDDDGKNIEKIKGFSNLESMKTLGEIFSKLKDSQAELKSNLDILRKNLKNTKHTDSLVEKIRNSNLKKNLMALAQQGDHFRSDVLLKMLSFLRLIYLLPKVSESFENTEKFLEQFQEIRNNLFECEDFVKEIGPKFRRTHDIQNDYSNPILKLENSQEMALSLARGMFVLRDMVQAIRARRRLNRTLTYSKPVHDKIIHFNGNGFVKEFWNSSRKKSIEKLISDLDTLNLYAEKIENEPPLNLRKILDEATKIQGFPEVFKHIHEQFQGFSVYPRVRSNFGELSKMDLDFASHKGYLHAASLSFDELKTYFDDVFGFNDTKQEIEQNHLAAALICIAIFLLIIIGAFLAYGLTPTGRRRYKNYYLYYFGKPEMFEKRWRYSLFMDRQDGKNALLDAAREINATNVLKALKKGAYINVFNRYGNTALHVATKRAHPEIVEILIKNGADRNLLNAQNKTPEQMIPHNYKVTQLKEKVKRFEAVEKIYRKYQKKKFRPRVPYEFPVSSYHIYIDNTTDDTLTDKFTEKFQSITTDEPSITTTHFVVRTDKDGILETENLEIIAWALSGLIVVKDKWMIECLKNEKQISNEWDFSVKKIRYGGTVYDTVGKWREAMAKAEMPFLQGVYVAVVITDYPNLPTLVSIVTTHGGTVLDKFPEKEAFNQGFRPYLHVNMGPFVIIHDGKINLDNYRNDPDKMYTLMTEQEFVHFLLARKVKRNKSTYPIPALNDLED